MDRSRYRIRKIGSRFDYVHRFAVVDTQTGTGRPYRVDGIRGGLVESDARDLAAELNEQAATREPTTTTEEAPTMLTPSNYFKPREDCALPCPIGAGLTEDGRRHNASCAIVADTGHAYREAVAREAERLRAGDPADTDGDVHAYAMTVGRYDDEQVVGIHITDNRDDARALAGHMTLMRARRNGDGGYGPRSIPADLIEVRAEPVPLLDRDGTPIERRVRLEIVR